MLTVVNTYKDLVHFIIALFISLCQFNCPDMQDYVYCVSTNGLNHGVHGGRKYCGVSFVSM